MTVQVSGYSIQVGKNAFSNESLVGDHKRDHPKCLWFHALGAGGSHVVLCIEGKDEPGNEVLKRAAKLALEYSRTRGISVRVARLSNLEKPTEAGPGVWHARHFVVQDVF